MPDLTSIFRGNWWCSERKESLKIKGPFLFCCYVEVVGQGYVGRRPTRWEDPGLGGFRWWLFLSCHNVRSSRCRFWSHRKNVFLGCLPTPLTPISCIVLQGQWIERDHCTITSACGVVILRPAQGARCTVNGREVTASCRLTQGKTAYSSIYARLRDGLPPFSWAKPRELSEAGFKDGTPNLCTQRCEDFLIPSSSHKQGSLNSRVPGWRMTLWNLYLSLGKSLNLSFLIYKTAVRGLLWGFNELVHVMFFAGFLAPSKYSLSSLLLVL